MTQKQQAVPTVMSEALTVDTHTNSLFSIMIGFSCNCNSPVVTRPVPLEL